MLEAQTRPPRTRTVRAPPLTRRHDARTPVGAVAGSTYASLSRLRLHGRRLFGPGPRPARLALRAGGPALTGRASLPGPRSLGSGPGPGGRQWPAMQLQPNTNADKDVAVLLCGSRDWTDEDAVRAQLERAVGRFGAERLVVIAGGALRRPPGRGVCPRAGPGRRGLPIPLGSPGPLGGLPSQRPDARPARRLPAPLRDRLLHRQSRHPAHDRPGASARHSRPGCRPRSSTTLTRTARTRPSMRDNSRAPAPMSPRRARELQR
jgi:hypothetical protein